MSINPLDALLDIGKIAIEKIWPDPTKRAQEMRLLEELRQKGNLAELQAHVELLTGQMKINMKEAEHKSIFVAGWRPFVGWTCGVGLAYVSIIEPLMRFIATMYGYTGEFPVIDTTLTMQVLLGMLGISISRSWEKSKGVETKRIGEEG